MTNSSSTGRTVRLLALLPLLALGAACDACADTDPGEDAGPSGDAADAKELCVAYTIGNDNFLNGVFHSFGRCSATDAWPTYDGDVLDDIEASCVEGNEFYDQFVIAFEGGRVTIDVDAALRCVEKGRTAKSGSTIFSYNQGEGPVVDLFDDPDCADAALPRQGSGDACVQAWDCPDDVPCQADPPDSADLRCLAPAAQGDACGGARFCGTDLYCSGEVCVPALESGDNCVTDNADGSRPCVEGTWCDANDTQLCQPLKPENAACVGGDCEEGLICEGDPQVCTATVDTPAVADGVSCDVDADFCESYCSVCMPDSAGGATTCQDRRGAGGFCEEDGHCAGAFICNTTTSECETAPEVQLPGLGQACDVEGCAEGECVFDVCTAGVEGDACEPSFSACQVDLVCLANPTDATRGSCVAAPAIGETCIEGVCGAGAFCNPDDECAALREAGRTCASADECLSGECRESTNTCGAVPTSCYSSRSFFTQVLTLALLLPLASRLRRRRRRET
jgi:hypothetical protein